MLYGPHGDPIDRQDCTVRVDLVKAYGRDYTDSYVEWSMPDGLKKRMLTILRAHRGQIHFFDFLKEYTRRYLNG